MVEAIRNSPPADFQNVPEFQTDSQFDLSKYQRWLTSSVAAEYLPMLEAQYRDQIQRSKLLRVVTADVYLSDPALWEQYRDEHEMVKIGLTAIVPRNAVPDSSVKLTDAEIESYYRAHLDDFKRPATAFLSFVALPRFTNASDTALALARADSARAEIVAGTPFADVARRESADTASAEKGGELGEWTKGAMDPAFDSAAFCAAAQDGVQAGAFAVRLPPDRGHQPLGEEGQRSAHSLPDRSRPERIATSSTPGPTVSSAWPPSGPSAVTWTPRRRRWASPSARPVRCRRGPGCRWAIWWCRTPGCGPSRPRRALPGPSSRPSIAFYVFRLDSLQAEGIPALAQIRPAVTFAARNDKEAGARQGDRPELREAAGLRRLDGRRGQGHEPPEPGVRSVQPDQSRRSPTRQ